MHVHPGFCWGGCHWPIPLATGMGEHQWLTLVAAEGGGATDACPCHCRGGLLMPISVAARVDTIGPPLQQQGQMIISGQPLLLPKERGDQLTPIPVAEGALHRCLSLLLLRWMLLANPCCCRGGLPMPVPDLYLSQLENIFRKFTLMICLSL